jgi:hypothetical protein
MSERRRLEILRRYTPHPLGVFVKDVKIKGLRRFPT